jgi:nucleoside-diphosphate-sugar epimerase
MKNALIGYNGFLGSNLKHQTEFDFFFNSKNIENIKNNRYDLVICCAPNAEKWLANKEPIKDLENINKLILNLKDIKCNKFILLSTVDVFSTPHDINEDTLIDEKNLEPYGLNRRILEKFIETNFNNRLIIRLPGLVGPGLKKNAIFDLHNDNEILKIDSRNLYQFYPVVNLWKSIILAHNLNIKLVHFNSEPISVFDIAKYCFGKVFINKLNNLIQNYDLKSLYVDDLFGRSGSYFYNKSEIINYIKTYVNSEEKINNK